MRGTDLILKFLAVTALATFLWGCSKANDQAPMLDASGRHPAGWVELHQMQFVNNQDQCRECHGQDLKGGISRVSCSSASIGAQICHAKGPAGHPRNWPLPTQHGAAAKKAPGTMSGFATCRGCHGSDFKGDGAAASCFACHTTAPHSPAPWLSSAADHTTTDQQNAMSCALCHLNNARLTVPVEVPPGVTPGCFNNTLCHGPSGHPAGWSDPAQHGAAAKDTPGPGRGLERCRACHGSDFKGIGTAASCFACHATAPHSPAPWRIFAGSPSTHRHTDTNSLNAQTCALCHLNNARLVTPVPVPPGATPGCFNNSLCHGNVGAPHVVPFTDPALHGPPAKADLTFCQGCHGQSGGPGSNPRFNIPIGSLATGCEGANCHNVGTAHPDPAKGFTFWAGHRTAGNLAVACALCHGATLGGGTGPACSTCHTIGSPLTIGNCGSCHGNPPPPPAEANFTHREHDTLAPNLTGKCDTCHTGAGSGTVLHFNGVINVIPSPTFYAKSGTASFDATSGTCTNISCHGGITTPPWKTGLINVSTDCTSCHTFGTTQYNSYFSGQHQKHIVEVGLACTVCHDTVKLAVNHFTTLDTHAMEGPASATLKTATQYNGTTCNPQAGGLTGCHGQESWR